MEWGFIISVMLTGLIVVFVALVILIVIISIFGAVSSRALKEKNNDAKEEEANVPITIKASEDADSEIVAVISAAVTALRESEGSMVPFKIKSVKQSGNNRPVWSAAGLYDNTKPF